MVDHFRSPSKVLRDVCEIKPLNMGGLDVSEFRILLIGQVSAGKSSFYNTINSIFRGYVTSQAITGNAGRSVTTMFRMYDVMPSPFQEPFKWKICDTVGLLPDNGLSVSELLYLVDGNIPNRFQFSPYGGITPDSPGFIEAPSHSQRAHCVALVIDASTVDTMAESMWQKYRMFQDALNARRVPLVVLLTKIDLACSQTQDNLLHVFHSQHIQQVVRTISTSLQGLPTNRIFPIKNYEWETELNMHVNSLALLALRQMLRFAQDYIEDKSDYLREVGAIRRRFTTKELLVALLVLIVLFCSVYAYFVSWGKLFDWSSYNNEDLNDDLTDDALYE